MRYDADAKAVRNEFCSEHTCYRRAVGHDVTSACFVVEEKVAIAAAENERAESPPA